MKRKIRKSVFETNSSSTHSLILADVAVFNEWKAGDLCFRPFEERFYAKRDAISHLNLCGGECEEELDDLLRENDFFSREEYAQRYGDFEELYKTPWNDGVVVFGYH